MDLTYWQKQKDKPLFADIEWSRPQNKRQAGNLLVIGGAPHDFKSVSETYMATQEASPGEVRLILPHSLEKILGKVISKAHYLPDNSAGTFSQQAFPQLVGYKSWANGLLLPGSLGNNSETTATLSKYLILVEAPTVLAGDAVGMLKHDDNIFMSNNTALVLNLPQLQSLSIKPEDGKFVTSNSGLVQIVEFLHLITKEFPLKICLTHENTVLVASAGEVVSTSATNAKTHQVAAHVAVYWMQFPDKFMEAANAAVWALRA